MRRCGMSRQYFLPFKIILLHMHSMEFVGASSHVIRLAGRPPFIVVCHACIEYDFGGLQFFIGLYWAQIFLMSTLSQMLVASQNLKLFQLLMNHHLIEYN